MSAPELPEKKFQKLDKKARKYLLQAEAFLETNKLGKASKGYELAADIFSQDLKDFERAEDAYFNAAKVHLKAQDFVKSAVQQRNAANMCILLGDFERADKYYEIALKYFLKEDKVFDAIIVGSFAYLTMFVRGLQDKALDYIKRVKKNVPFEDFKNNRLIQLVRGLTVSIVDKNFSELNKIQEELARFKFREAESKLIQLATELAQVHVHAKLDLSLPTMPENKEFLVEAIIPVAVNFDSSPITTLPELKPRFSEILITNAGVTLSENLSLKAEPNFPITIPMGEQTTLDFQVRVNFPEDPTFIGPALLTCEMGGGSTEHPPVRFFAKSPLSKFKTMSPPAQIGINLRELAPPVIGQSFPMEVTLSNQSDGEAVRIEVDLEFPPELKVFRGTTKKTIYSLPPNQDISWQLTLKPKEPGKFPIKVIMQFEDSNGNVVGPQTAELPFEIKL